MEHVSFGKQKLKVFSKYAAFGSLAVLVAVMAAATVVEKVSPVPAGGGRVYGAPWFVALWMWCAGWSLVYGWQVRRTLRGPVVLLHAAWVVILCGAWLTHLCGRHATLHLREGQPVSVATDAQGHPMALPFVLTLERFHVACYPGTQAPMDYVSRFRLTEGGQAPVRGEVAMNRVFRHRFYRFYQSGYDADGRGAVWMVSHDPWGIGVSYTGYALLWLGWLWLLGQRAGRFRRLLGHPWLRRGLTCLVLLPVGWPAMSVRAASAPTELPRTLPREVAADFGRLYVLYNDRVCPLQTLARQFTLKLCGADSWRGLTAEQVLTGWMFYYSSWSREPMFRIHGRAVRQQLGLTGRYACLQDFLDSTGRMRLREPYADADVARAAEQYNLLPMLYSGRMLRLFPLTYGGRTLWVGQNDVLPPGLSAGERVFVQKSVNCLQEMAFAHDYDAMRRWLAQMRRYQQQRGGDSLPTEAAFRAERVYNALDHTLPWALVCVVAGLTAFVAAVGHFAAGRRPWWGLEAAAGGVVLGVWAYLTLMLGLRGWVSGHWPLANGYETMQFLAWAALGLGVLLRRRFFLAFPLALLVGGMALLVSAMGESQPQLTPLMPVLASPLLSLHVVTVMLSFALLAFLMFNGVAACVVARRQGWRSAAVARLTLVGRLLLFPALALLSVGIFVGAMWANVSWGTYWSWDPKEVWALITLLVYALPLHVRSLPAFRRHSVWQVYMVLAFLTVLATYFGVNFLLGGMHSYA